MTRLLNKLHNSVIVSCQARKGEPFDSPMFIAEFAKSAKIGGAQGVRINGKENILKVKEEVNLPIIGIKKNVIEGHEVFITPTINDLDEIIQSGVEIVGIDGTTRNRPIGSEFNKLVDYAHAADKLVLADIATKKDAEFAISQGADMLATTLVGYTKETKGINIPDFDFLEFLVKQTDVPIFLEGGVTKLEEVKKAIEMGAHGVIIGKAITMPHDITSRFVNKIKEME